jgi:hypothetical protein
MYGRGNFVGDFIMGNIICVKILPRAIKLTPSINYFLILPYPWEKERNKQTRKRLYIKDPARVDIKNKYM